MHPVIMIDFIYISLSQITRKVRHRLVSFLLIAGRALGIVRNDATSTRPIVYSSSSCPAVTNHVPLQSRENKYLPHNGHCLRNGPINTLRTDYVIGCRLGIHRRTDVLRVK